MDSLPAWYLIIVPILLVAVYLWAAHIERLDAQHERDAAYEAYRAALSELAANPASADHHQRAMRFGMAYAAMARDEDGVATFDEAALLRDIDAALSDGRSRAR